MNVSRGSWHYKLNVFVRTLWRDGDGVFKSSDRVKYEPKNLCRYFWSTVGLTASVPFFIVVVFVVVCGIFPFMWAGEKIRDADRTHRAKIAEKRLAKGLPAAKTKKVKEKHPNILLAYVKARKAKACPLINLVD